MLSVIIGLLSWFIVIPLFWLTEKASWKKVVLVGAVSSALTTAAVLYWLKDFNQTVYFSLILVSLLWGIVTIFPLKYLLAKAPLAVPAFLTIVEYLRSSGEFGLPIQVIGYTQYALPRMIQTADLGGVWLISFWIYFFGILVYKKYFKYAAGLIIVLWGYSLVYQPLLIGQVRVGLIQPNVNMFFSDWKDRQDYFFGIYEKLSLQAAKQKPDVIIWPETSIGISLRKSRDAAKQVRKIIDQSKADFLIGNMDERMFSLRFKEKYNSAYYIDKRGKVIAEHNKSKLIPFIEQINYQAKTGHYLKGEKKQSMRLNNYVAAVVICFEAVFGDHVRKFTAPHANIIYNLSSDGWSKSSAEHQMNFLVNIFRAVENRLYLVRVSDNGISGIISPTGNVIAIIPAFQQGVLVQDVPLLKSRTLYSMLGDKIIWLFVLMLGGLLIIERRKTK